MSYSLDVNVLLYASDRSSDRHDHARRFVEACAAGPELLCLAWPTLMSYLRIATHPRIFAAPLSPRMTLLPFPVVMLSALLLWRKSTLEGKTGHKLEEHAHG